MARPEKNKSLRTTRIVYVTALVLMVAFSDLLRAGLSPVVAPAGGDLGLIAIVLAFLSAFLLGYAFFLLPRLMLRPPKERKPEFSAERVVFWLHILRAAAFGSLAVYGLLLGLLGAGLSITLPFLVASALALLATFPTTARWKKMAEAIEPPTESAPR